MSSAFKPLEIPPGVASRQADEADELVQLGGSEPVPVGRGPTHAGRRPSAIHQRRRRGRELRLCLTLQAHPWMVWARSDLSHCLPLRSRHLYVDEGGVLIDISPGTGADRRQL